jgi:hypothetical protein
MRIASFLLHTIPFLQVFTRKLVYGTDMIPESLENSGFPAIATD